MVSISSISTILTSLIELATPETMAFAFTINTVAWRFGTLIAPFIGGLLAEPATYYPNLFKDTVWDRYPYALSGVGVSRRVFAKESLLTHYLVQAASIPLLSIALGLFIVPETLREDRKRSIWSILRGLTAARDTTRNSTANVEPLGGLFTKPVCFMLSLWALYVVSRKLSCRLLGKVCMLITNYYTTVHADGMLRSGSPVPFLINCSRRPRFNSS